MKKFLTPLLAIVLLFTACGKDDPPAPAATLVGKWTLDQTIIKEYVNNAVVSSITIPSDGTTFDFQGNGNLVITHPGNVLESMPYTIQPNSKVNIDGDVFDVQSLTTTNVTIYHRQDLSAGEYDEVIVKLKR